MSWFRALNGSRRGRAMSRTASAPTARNARPRLEALEERVVPTVTYHGGAVLSHVEVQALYYGSNWVNNPSLNQRAVNFEGFLSYLVNSPYMDMLNQAGYGVGRGTFSSGFTYNVGLNSNQFVTESTLRSVIQAEIDNGNFGTPDANRLYVIFVEPNVAVKMLDGSNSVQDFAAVHGAFAGHTANNTAADIHFAIIPTPYGSAFGVGNGSNNYSLVDFDEMTEACTHEVAEAMTDPNVNYKALGWYDDNLNGEIGDIVNGQYLRLNGYAVQKEVAQNDNFIVPTTTNTFEIATFSNGLWRYSPSQGWVNLNGVQPVAAAVDANGDVVASFAGYGVARYEDATGWVQLGGATAYEVSIAGNGIVAAAFANAGLWRYKNNTGWQKLSAAAVQDLGVDANGDIAASLIGAGLWRFKDTTNWVQLSSVFATHVGIAGNGNVVASFYGGGTWRYTDATNWQQLSSSDAYQVAIDAQGDVAAAFAGAGLWLFTNGVGWKQLSSLSAFTISMTSNGIVVAEFAGAGVWRYENASGWVNLNEANASIVGVG
jgi:hypothetical protein